VEYDGEDEGKPIFPAVAISAHLLHFRRILDSQVVEVNGLDGFALQPLYNITSFIIRLLDMPAGSFSM
jgi:hypothetical protein